MKVIIIGGVAAGATAAAKTRRLSPDAEIIMLEAGPDISFANCGLPYYIGGDIKSRSKLILQSPQSFKDQYNVDVYTNTEVIEIDRARKTIIALDKNQGKNVEFPYDKLILAQGGKPIKPAIEGSEKPHVFTLWTLENMDAITSHIDETQPKSAVIVGGGFIGLEMVEALAKRGLKVSVVEAQPHVMSIMDAEIAGFIEQEMKSYQVDVHTSDSVVKIDNTSVSLQSGQNIDADMVILSIGVRPTITLADKAKLPVGESGGLAVNEYLQTEDENIFAAGDMVEIKHRVNGKLVRIPLAGPANKQGRIAAENALGGKHPYKGSIGTSVVRVFEAVAGITGMSLKAALSAGYKADTVIVHKEHHTSYYPGSEPVTVALVFDTETGIILGGQTAGYKGADKRLDVLATFVAQKLTISDLADVDFSYSPPIGTPNDALNMAAFTAENKLSSYSPSVASSQLDDFVLGKDVFYIDVRDIFAYKKSHIENAINIPLELLQEEISSIPRDKYIVVYDETGKKGHQTLRTLVQAGFENVINISGGHTSLQRHGFAVGFKNVLLQILDVETKKLGQEQVETEEDVAESIEENSDENSCLIVDVRTPGEFNSGAFPDAINIPLDYLQTRYTELGSNLEREIIVYCATGARSAYAQQLLQTMGYSDVKNGGGLMQMMRSMG